jgi:hypothetical protein
MIQQINLYQDSLNAGTRSDINPYLLAVIASIAFFVSSSVLSWYVINNQESERQLLQQQLRQSAAELLTLQSQLPDPQKDNLINQEIQQSQYLYQNLSQIVELLADTQNDQTQGFSHYLSALAEQADSTVWLSRIRINAISNDISLSGSSFTPAHIPLMLQHLQTTAAFKGRHFARLDMQQSEKNPEQIDFSVSSNLNPDTEDKNDHQP